MNQGLFQAISEEFCYKDENIIHWIDHVLGVRELGVPFHLETLMGVRVRGIKRLRKSGMNDHDRFL